MDEKALREYLFLKGGDSFITENNKDTYIVEEGTVLVYVVPVFKDGKNGRRFLVHESLKGETIPSFCHERNNCKYCFCFCALESAKIRVKKDSMEKDSGDRFLSVVNIKCPGEDNFADIIIEVYNSNCVKEEVYIYSTGEDKKVIKEKNLRLIYNLFDKKKRIHMANESGNKLYDAIQYICLRKNIEIAPYDKVVLSSGRKFSVEDVARVSVFIIRDIKLDNGWWKKDSDPLICFTKKGHEPVAFMTDGIGRYYFYNPKNHEYRKVDKSFEDKFEKSAYAIYAPFPNKKMSIKDMLKFSFKATDTIDWVRFLFLTLLGTIISILLPVITEQIYDGFIPAGMEKQLIEIGMVLLACNVGNLAFAIVKNLSSLRNVNKMKNTALAALSHRVFNLPISFFRKYNSADISGRVLQLESTFNEITSTVFKLFVSAAFSILYLIQMNRMSHDLMKFSFVMTVIVIAFILIMTYMQNKYEKELLEYGAEAQSKMSQYLSGIQKIRSSSVEDVAVFEYLKPYTKSKELGIKKERISGIINTICVVSVNIFALAIYYKVMSEQRKHGLLLSTGQFSAFMSSFGMFSASMIEAAKAVPIINAARPVFKRIKPIIETLPEHFEESELPKDIKGNIEIDNLSFKYEEEGPDVINDLSLHIKKGEYIGIVGSSGCGKSTLLRLLLGFERPTSGKIYYDLQDIERLDKRELRKKIGVVLQEGKLFSGSIYDNIVIACPKAKLSDVEKAVETAGLAEDISKLPMGLHTIVSDMGGTISGGQMQRVLIARAIIGNPNVLFFDEATSSLDNETQKVVCDGLKNLKATRIVIAHRLSTVIECDRILVMNNGKIEEEGNFDTLMAKRGVFYELAKRQMA